MSDIPFEQRDIIGWRVLDYAGEWVYFDTIEDAQREHDATDGLMEPVYVKGSPCGRVAPSQPAGAREWLLAHHRANPGHVNWRLMLRHEDIVVELLEAYARQQTAAADAEAKYYREQMASAHDGIEYLQRERDSLRADLKELRVYLNWLLKERELMAPWSEE